MTKTEDEITTLPRTEAIPRLDSKIKLDTFKCNSLVPIGSDFLSVVDSAESVSFPPLNPQYDLAQLTEESSTSRYADVFNQALMKANHYLRNVMFNGLIRVSQARNDCATHPIPSDAADLRVARPIPVVHEEVELTPQAALILEEILSNPKAPRGRPLGVRRLLPEVKTQK